jgi:diguanylate cyclase (GGDEF)-like protein
MKNIRFYISVFSLLLVVYINVSYLYLKDRILPIKFYIVSLSTFVFLLIVIKTLYDFQMLKKIENLQRENEKQKLILSDYKIESTFLEALTEIIETFGEDLTLDEIIERILGVIKNIYKEETTIICLFGDKYKLSFKGQEIEFPIEVMEELAIRGKPVLVNNISSFPQYEKLKNFGVKSFIATGLWQKKNIIGLLGIFSLINKKFTVKDLNLIRMVSIPISLMLENVELLEKTKLLSITDSLTQIYNRRHFEKMILDLLIKSQMNHSFFAVAMCDVDFFKFYNDINGHLAGDFVLKTIANILKREIKGSDILARYGGEEFVILFPNTTKENAIKICEKLRQRIKDFKFPNEESQPNGDLTISFGVSSFPEDGSTPEELIKKADMALYKAKELGKDKVIAA